MKSSNEDWRPPAGLGYSSLRPVRLNGQGKLLAGVVAFLVIGGFVLGIFLARTQRREVRQQLLLEQQGISGDAVVTRVWRTADKEAEPRVAYRFTFEGAVYHTSVRAPLDRWRRIKAGDHLPIRFVPSQPSISHPVDWSFKGMPKFFPYIATALLAGIGAFLAIYLARQMRLLAEGRAAPGRITAIRRAKGVVAHYEFELNGVTYKGRSRVRKPPSTSEPVTILYDPENPKRHALYPLDTVKLDN
jgi:hypothetical protein